MGQFPRKEESFAMASLASTRSRAFQSLTLLVLLLLLPATAWAGWGTERWGEMVWGEGTLSLPSLSVWGQLALAMLLLVLPGKLLLKRCRQVKP